MKFEFEGKLSGADATVLPVHCEIQPPRVGGQAAKIRIAVPAQHITKNPPSNPCFLLGTVGAVSITMQGIHWRSFPASSKSNFGLEDVELLHIDRVIVQHPSVHTSREIRFHLAPVSYLESEASWVPFSGNSDTNNLFILDIPGVGTTKFVIEWVAVTDRGAKSRDVMMFAGYSAIVSLQIGAVIDVEQIVSNFRRSLEVLSVLFRQAVSLHGWTCTGDQTVSTWISPLEPNVTPSAREHRGNYVAQPHAFVTCAQMLVDAYEKADAKNRSLVRHLIVSVNPHNNLRINDRFLFMFSALERVIEANWAQDQTPRSPTIADDILKVHLKELRDSIVAAGGEHVSEISARLDGLIKAVERSSFRDKLNAFLRAYPKMNRYLADLWPVLGSKKIRGLKDVRDAIAHGRGSFVSVHVIAVAEWHLAILLERLIFVLLDIELAGGIVPDAPHLRASGKRWYERDWWQPLRSKPDQSI